MNIAARSWGLRWSPTMAGMWKARLSKLVDFIRAVPQVDLIDYQIDLL